MDDLYKFASMPNAIKNLYNVQPLLRELHVIYNVYPYCVDNEKVHLIHSNGLYFGRAEATTKNNTLVYGVTHPKICKERGGRNKNTRNSSSLKALITILRKEIPLTKPSYDDWEGNLPKIYDRVTSQVNVSLGRKRTPHLKLSESDEECIALHIMNQQPLPQETQDRIIAFLKELDSAKNVVNEIKERLSYFDNIYLLYGSNVTPLMFAEMTKHKHRKKYDQNHVDVDVYYPVGDWRIVKNIEDLPDAAVSLLKMWELSVSGKFRMSNYLPDVPDAPLSRFLVQTDDYFQDFDVITRYDSYSNGYKDCFVVVAKGPSHEKSD